MANFSAIHSVGASLATFLDRAFRTLPEGIRQPHDCRFRVFSSNELARLQDGDMEPTVGLYLYRITWNEHHRNRPIRADGAPQKAAVVLDLHYLITFWADSPLTEHILAAWVLHTLETHAVLDVSVLSAEAGWDPGDMLQILPEDLAPEDMMRLWDALAPPYRLSLAYVVRPVAIEGVSQPEGRPVAVSAFGFGEKEAR
ncbi:MAG: DUF4255 domain-containing protein [Desulfosoma sp.]